MLEDDKLLHDLVTQSNFDHLLKTQQTYLLTLSKHFLTHNSMGIDLDYLLNKLVYILKLLLYE
jgi:hypothetical protein